MSEAVQQPVSATQSHKALWITSAVVAILAAAGGGLWWQNHRALPPVDGPPAPIVRLVANERFKTLPMEQRQAYIERLEKLPMDQRRAVGQAAGLTGDQAKAAYRAIYDQAVRFRIQKYYSFRTQAERDAYLDKLIEEFKREQAFVKAPPIDASKIKQQLESVPANERAQAASFVQDFVKRGIMKGLGLAK